MTPGWSLTLILLCVVSVIFGFLWRIGYEFHIFRSILARARYLTIYKYEISLEGKFWIVTHRETSVHMCVSGSYPRFTSAFPLRLHVDWFCFSYQDESSDATTTDFSGKAIKLPSFHPWIHYAVHELLRLSRPSLIVDKVDVTYSYKSSVQGKIMRWLSSISGVDVDIFNRRCTSKSCDIVLAIETNQAAAFRDFARITVTGPCECHLKHVDEIDVVVSSADLCYYSDETLHELLDRLRTFESLDLPTSTPSRTRFKAALVIREKVHSSVSFEDKCSFQTTMKLGSHSGGRRISSSGNITGLFITVTVDPFSLKLFQLSVHNYTNKGTCAGIKNILAQVLVRGVGLVALSCSGSNLIGEFKEDGHWNINVRSQQIATTLLDKTGNTADSILALKMLSVSGSHEKGVSVALANADIDISARMLNKAIRVYLRLLSLISGPVVEGTPSTNTTPIVSSLLSNTDPNFALLQKKYWSSMSNPPTPPLNESMSTAEPMSRSTSSVSVAQADTGNVKNWRAMERIMFEGGKVLMSFAIDQIVLRNKDLIQVSATKLKTTSKISSTGSPFTTVCCDGFAVNDNVFMNGGLRIWIDGNISSELSRVFCLVPPISIRFDSNFAEIVETFFLELVEVLKVMNRKHAAGPPDATTKQFIEFLQISSLQLELHAKEMLGVLALDKAMINLTRSSVYKSNGIWDALNTLTSQYREEVVGQWFSLLTRLDVSIGRPMSTARKILTDIFGRPDSPSQ
jgi:hypothetical protein